MIAERWGVSAAEVARRYPCDDFVVGASLQAWRGVTVDAPPARVWPWVVQLRLAPYSYDWIDNLGRRSPRALAALPDPRVGERFTTCGGRPVGRVVAVAAGESLTARIAATALSYVLVPEGEATRLLFKMVGRQRGPAATLLRLGDLVMSRRQLLNLAQLAEGPCVSRAG